MNKHVRIEWDLKVPVAVREYFIEPITRLAPLVCPTWMHELSVEYDPDSEHGMWCRGDIASRWGVIGLTGNSIPLYQREGDRVIVHELVHFHIRPLQDLFQFATVQIGGKAEKALDRNWTELYEGATEDLARAFTALMDPSIYIDVFEERR